MNLIDKYNLNDPACKFRLNKPELIVSSLAVNLISLALPVMVLQVYDRVLSNNSIETLSMLTFGVFVAIILEGILRIARAYTTSWTGMMYEYTMSANAMRYYINADPAKLRKEGVGKQIQNLTTFSKLRDFYGGQTLVTMVDIPFAFIFLGLIMYLTGKLVLIPIILILIFGYVTWLTGNKLMDSMQQLDADDDKRYDFIIEALQGIHSIKSYGIESIFKRRYERMKEDSSRSNYKTALISTQGYNLGSLFNETMIVAVVAFGAPMVMNNEMSSGALIATVLLSGKLVQPIQKALFLWSGFQDYRIATQKAEEIFSMHQIKRWGGELENEKIGLVELKDLGFTHGTKSVFSGLNLKVKLPEAIAIHGAIYSGKTTLMSLIAGIFEPGEGEILVDNMPASSIPSAKLVHHVGFISPESVMFHGTIMDNLTAFNEAKEADAIELAKLLGIDNEIALLPQGYETKINDGHTDTIPPGIKQRIAIIRVLINKPKVILFNNADKGLDRDGYNCLVSFLSLLKGKVAMIIVTEDKNINRLADKHFLLKDGSLSEIEVKDSNIFNVKPYKELKI
ncbi:MAG: ABC transporter [Rickettsiales bacterium]|nr:MAG: ABC transporter [Rickettsiales bacterium]